MHLLAFAETIQLFPDGTLLLHVALILVMIYVLNRTLYKPLNKVIASRESSRGGHSNEAKDILKDVEAKESTYTREMLETRSKGYELIEKEQREAVAEREAKLTAAKTEVAQRFNAGKSELESQSTAAKEAISSEAQKIADSIAANILKA